MEPIVITFDCNPTELVAMKQRTQAQNTLYGYQQLFLSNTLEDIFLDKSDNSGIFRCNLLFNMALKNVEEKKQRLHLAGKYQCQKPELAKLCGFMLNFLSLELDLYHSHIVEVSSKKVYAAIPSIVCTLEKL
jgi:hypothetical protein